jgi:hypothetical protein
MDDADELNYAWYEFRLHAAAIGMWQVGGRDLLRRPIRPVAHGLHGRVTTDLDSIHPGFGDVERSWPA